MSPSRCHCIDHCVVIVLWYVNTPDQRWGFRWVIASLNALYHLELVCISNELIPSAPCTVYHPHRHLKVTVDQGVYPTSLSLACQNITHAAWLMMWTLGIMWYTVKWLRCCCYTFAIGLDMVWNQKRSSGGSLLLFVQCFSPLRWKQHCSWNDFSPLCHILYKPVKWL